MRKTIPEKDAISLMQAGSVLIREYREKGRTYFVVPGGPVTDEVAKKLKAHPLVRGQDDCFWPGLDQTWRMEQHGEVTAAGQ